MPLQYTGIGRTLQLFTQQNTYQIKHPSNIPHFWKQKLGKHFSVQNTCKNKTCFKNIRHLATDMPMKFIGKWWKMNYFLILWIVISKILWCSYHCTQRKSQFLPFCLQKNREGRDASQRSMEKREEALVPSCSEWISVWTSGKTTGAVFQVPLQRNVCCGAMWISCLLLQDKSYSNMVPGLHFLLWEVTINELFTASKLLFGPLLKTCHISSE